MSDNTCEQCDYFNPDEYPEYGYGGCHRYPPQFDFNTISYTPEKQLKARFPSVHPEDWCGEFRHTAGPTSDV